MIKITYSRAFVDNYFGKIGDGEIATKTFKARINNIDRLIIKTMLDVRADYEKRFGDGIVVFERPQIIPLPNHDFEGNLFGNDITLRKNFEKIREDDSNEYLVNITYELFLVSSWQ